MENKRIFLRKLEEIPEGFFMRVDKMNHSNDYLRTKTGELIKTTTRKLGIEELEQRNYEGPRDYN